MKRSLLVLGMCFLLVTFGCKSASHRGGEQPSEQGFRVVVPRSVDLKQGEARTVTIRLDRGNHFKQDVKLAIQVSNPGVSVEPMETVDQAIEHMTGALSGAKQ